MKKIFVVATLVESGSLMAAGGHGAASLIPAIVNVSLLAGAIIYFLKGKASSFFTKKSSNISEMMDRASSKAKEAEEAMANQKERISNLDSEIEKLKKDQESIISEFEKSYATEVKERISKLKEDTELKVEAERSELFNELNADLLDLVVNNAKAKIKNDLSLAKSAAANLIKGL